MPEKLSKIETPEEKFRNHITECKLELTEIKEKLSNIEEILIKIIEKGAEFDPAHLRALRTQLKNLLISLGLKGLQDLPIIYSFISNESQKRIKPDWYPDLYDFRTNISDLLYSNSSRNFPPESLKDGNIMASDVAQYAVLDPQLEGRGGLSLAEYLHNLGIMMLNKYAYEAIVGKTDHIQIGENWKVENGRHRSFVLRIFGKEIVIREKMNEWIIVKKEKFLI